MGTLTHAAIAIAVLICNALIANKIGRYFTEVRRPLLNFKPFTCRECLTFWLTVWGGFFIAGVAGCSQLCALTLCVLAVIFATINFLYIKSKIKIYE